MPVLRIPTPLRSYTSGQSEVNVSGLKISDALTDLTTQYPTIKPHIFIDSLRLFAPQDEIDLTDATVVIEGDRGTFRKAVNEKT